MVLFLVFAFTRICLFPLPRLSWIYTCEFILSKFYFSSGNFSWQFFLLFISFIHQTWYVSFHIVFCCVSFRLSFFSLYKLNSCIIFFFYFCIDVRKTCFMTFIFITIIHNVDIEIGQHLPRLEHIKIKFFFLF